MYRGTTPTHIFRTDVDLTKASVLFISYEQNGAIVLEKTRKEIEIKKDKLLVCLSQRETLLFSEGIVVIQIRAKFPDGSAIASDIIRTTAQEILKDGEI